MCDNAGSPRLHYAQKIINVKLDEIIGKELIYWLCAGHYVDHVMSVGVERRLFMLPGSHAPRARRGEQSKAAPRRIVVLWNRLFSSPGVNGAQLPQVIKTLHIFSILFS